MTPARVQPEVNTGLHVLLDAQSGQAERVKEALDVLLAEVQAEPETFQWFAYRLENDGQSNSFGMFSAFVGSSEQKESFSIITADRLKDNTQFLEGKPRTHTVQLLATKIPTSDMRAPQTGAQIIMKARPGFGGKLRSVLMGQYRLEIEAEEETPYWYALQFDETTFGLFAAFHSEMDRTMHLNGHAAYHLMDEISMSVQGIKTLHISIFAAKV